MSQMSRWESLEASILYARKEKPWLLYSLQPSSLQHGYCPHLCANRATAVGDWAEVNAVHCGEGGVVRLGTIVYFVSIYSQCMYIYIIIYLYMRYIHIISYNLLYFFGALAALSSRCCYSPVTFAPWFWNPSFDVTLVYRRSGVGRCVGWTLLSLAPWQHWQRWQHGSRTSSPCQVLALCWWCAIEASATSAFLFSIWDICENTHIYIYIIYTNKITQGILLV